MTPCHLLHLFFDAYRVEASPLSIFFTITPPLRFNFESQYFATAFDAATPLERRAHDGAAPFY